MINLLNAKKGFSEKEIKNIFIQLNKAFKIMYEKKIIHRDLKPENIFIKYTSQNKDDFIVKLGDFGNSREYQQKKHSTKTGTFRYMAPEILISEKSYIPTKCDLWSIGIIIYQLKFNDIPLVLLKGEIPDKFDDEKLNDLIKKLIVLEPENRIDWKDYFDKQWQSVFTNAESDIIRQELDWVKLIFDAFNIEITPRGINAFINSMWSISLLPDLKEIKYRYKALFVCKQSEILQDPLNAMVDLNYLIPLNKHFEEDNEYCKAIAALAYIVPLNRGEEIALIRPLESALSTGDSESIKKFVSVPSFSSILEKVLEKNGHNKLLENYVIALHGLTEDDFGGTEIYQNRWNTLYIFLNDKKYQLSMLGELYIEEYQLNLLEHITPVKQREMAMKIIESLNKVTDIAKFVSSIDALNETLSKYAVNVFNMLQHKKVSFDEPFMDCVRKYDERFF